MFNGSALARGEGLPQPEKNSLTNPCFIDGVTEEQNQVIQAGLNRVLALHASIIDPQMETLQA
jgi:hypothetical protein